MNSSISISAFGLPLPLRKGQGMACHAVALRRREVRGFETAWPPKPQTLTLLSPLGRERRIKAQIQVRGVKAVH